MNRKRALVTGSAGMVGHYIEDIFNDCDLLLTDILGDYDKLDVCNAKEAYGLIKNRRPDLVFHLAAATDVDKCEEDRSFAFRCNRDGTRNVALACRACGAAMVYISSGSVFSGKLGRPARETDEPDPVNIYGKSKLAGEQEVASILKEFYIVRAGWMMGGGPMKDKKFIGKIMKKILSGEKYLKVIDDKFGSPVYAKDLLLSIKRLLSSGNYGLYHVVNQDGCSRYDIALAIKEILKKDELKIEPVSSDNFNLSAPRALSEELENFKLKELGLNCMRPWKAALKEYLLEDWHL